MNPVLKAPEFKGDAGWKVLKSTSSKSFEPWCRFKRVAASDAVDTKPDIEFKKARFSNLIASSETSFLEFNCII